MAQLDTLSTNEAHDLVSGYDDLVVPFAGHVVDAKSGAGTSGSGKPGSGGSGGVVSSYTTGDPNVLDSQEFNIHINFSGSWTAQQQAVVEWAANFCSHVITGDVRDDVDLNGHLVDDIEISVSTGRIDGAGNPLTGNVLAQTGSWVVRDDGTVDQWLPLEASIKLDSTDLKSSSLSSTWDAIILHEMGHALGFSGAIFPHLSLVDGSNHFIGTDAVAAYGGSVPLEDGGGSGTAGSHWDEATFQPTGSTSPMSNELMTGYFTPGEQTLFSDTTLGAFADLGYTVTDPSPGASSVSVDSGLRVV